MTEKLLTTHSIQSIEPDQIDSTLIRKFHLEFLKEQCAIPVVLSEGQVAVAMADPSNIEAYDAIVAVLGQDCRRVSCPAEVIEQAISQWYYLSGEKPNTARSPAQPAKTPNRTYEPNQSHTEDLLNVANQGPVVKLVNKILFEALMARASDIHVEPYEDHIRIRFRIDGVLHDYMTLPKEDAPALLSRVKIMSNLNIAERRLPQDGQSRVQVADNCVDIRVSVIPTLNGERIVLRLLDKSNRKLNLQQIGFSEWMFEQFKKVINLPHGIILLTGPTGSGKTTTLYAALNALNDGQKNILTVEDPVEYQLPGIGQMQVKPKINLNFANCLRHILRQDPDIIMVGEIRDAETAQIAIQASLTGHLVLSTLHTNDAVSAITRLVDMGIEPYLISSSLCAVIAQRLVRMICPHCKTIDTRNITLPALLDEQGFSEQLYRGDGCQECFNTGYYDRTAVFEFLNIDDDIKEQVVRRSTTHAIRQLALDKGMKTLRDDGILKVSQGITTLEEVCRVTQDNSIPARGGIDHAGA